jgi:DNA helicase HerA-like ATPase
LDVDLVFGKEDERHFWIGSPLDMEAKVCLNLDELVKRSIGVFGKSGTGKTFLTRLLLVGILQGGRASSLIFDMHSEYGWSGQDTDRGHSVKGLKQLFPAQVSTFTLDEESSRRRGSSPDAVVRIGYGVMICTAFFQLFDGVGIVYGSALRGAGDTLVPSVFYIGSSWAIIVGGGWIVATYYPELGSLGPWLAASLLISVTGVFLWWRWRSGAWLK